MNRETNKLIDYTQNSIIDLVHNIQKNGEYESGSMIFKEGELAEKFRVSRSTIREAIRSLEVRGFVERVHGVGIRLIDNSLNVVTRSLTDMFIRKGINSDELLEVRRIIEIQAVKLAAERATDEFDAMEEVIKIMENDQVEYQQYIEADVKFHNLVLKATKNSTLCAIAKSYQFIFESIIYASTSSDYRPEISKGYHRKIMNCIKNRDPNGAERAMAEHLKATELNIITLRADKAYFTKTKETSQECNAIKLVNKMEEFDIFWFEEPVPPEDIDGYIEVKAKSKIPIP